MATGKPEESITQATFVDRLMKQISAEPMKDRDILKRRKSLPRPSPREAQRFIFQEFVHRREGRCDCESSLELLRSCCAALAWRLVPATQRQHLRPNNRFRCAHAFTERCLPQISPEWRYRRFTKFCRNVPQSGTQEQLVHGRSVSAR